MPISIRTYARKLASQGGKARARKLSPEQRREIARKGGQELARKRRLKARKPTIGAPAAGLLNEAAI